ncbi:hypothetical protein GE061_008101 [Apolygus lucorum]|uniref:RNase H type-1 domain-containing protein n=1 Tax=Apolygus lucorum TaxID=248454 RepID=A0A8S9WNW1_APOLU|nr:hypothetical protein GE061_008101 [Apolygus lucorum]
MYTDGSKFQNGDTASAHLKVSDHSSSGCKIHPANSIYQAELIAISNCLSKQINTPTNLPTGLLILTDSKAALEQLTNLKVGDNPPHILQKIINSIEHLRNETGTSTVLQWVPGHSYIHYNEEIDRIVKSIATSNNTIQKAGYTSYPDFVKVLKKRRDDHWRETHEERTLIHGHWTKSILSDPTRTPWYKGTHEKQQYYTTINRILSGHGNTPAFKHLMGHKEDPFCDDCQDDQETGSINHLLNNCNNYHAARRVLYDDLQIPLSNNIQDRLQRGLDPDILTKIYHFVRNNNLQL